MTKIEQKLIELGYEPYEFTYGKYVKVIIKNAFMSETALIIRLENMNNKIKEGYIIQHVPIKSQQDIDNLQQAYNQVQSDLEVLKEYEIH